jgi:hypothetical protein
VAVQNQGTFNEAFDVVLTDNTDGVTIGTRSVSLAASTSATVSFSWDTTNAELGGHTLTATAGPAANETDTADNSRSTTVAVEMPAAPVTDIAVTAVTAPASVVQSDLVSVGVTIENAGNQDVTSNITVTLSDDTDGITIGTQTIHGGLAAGDSSTVNFSWNTSGATVGKHTLTAHHDFADDDGGNDSRITTVTVQAKPAVPIAYVNIDMSVQAFWTLWRAAATVTITNGTAVINGATVQGRWSGAYKANVSGTTQNGQVSFGTGWILTAGTVTFTVDSVVKNSQSCVLYGETSDSINH